MNTPRTRAVESVRLAATEATVKLFIGLSSSTIPSAVITACRLLWRMRDSRDAPGLMETLSAVTLTFFTLISLFFPSGFRST